MIQRQQNHHWSNHKRMRVTLSWVFTNGCTHPPTHLVLSNTAIAVEHTNTNTSIMQIQTQTQIQIQTKIKTQTKTQIKTQFVLHKYKYKHKYNHKHKYNDDHVNCTLSGSVGVCGSAQVVEQKYDCNNAFQQTCLSLFLMKI